MRTLNFHNWKKKQKTNKLSAKMNYVQQIDKLNKMKQRFSDLQLLSLHFDLF